MVRWVDGSILYGVDPLSQVQCQHCQRHHQSLPLPLKMILPESPKWLIRQNRHSQIAKISKVVRYLTRYLTYFSFQPVLHDWCNKGRGMCYPVCGMVHIKEPLLLIRKSSLCGGSGFSFSLSEWSSTIMSDAI